MLKGMISNISAGLASGGTVDGDLVVTGDFKVEGAGSFAYDEIIQGTIGATRVNIGTRDASGNPPTDNASYMLQIEKYGGTANIKLSRTGNASSEWSNIHNEATIGTITEHPFVLQTHSTDRLTITSAGLVGIGTTSPSHPLHINSGVSNGQLMQLHNTNNADGTFIKFTGAHSTSEDWQIGSGTLGYYIYNLTDSSMGLMVSNAGKIGIGTTSPNTNLEVVGTIRASGATPIIQLKETDTSNAIQGFQINSSGGSISFNSLNNNDGFTSTDYQMHRTGSGAYYHKWFIANSSKMILNNSGNLGIGTDSPGEKLAVADGNIEAIMTTAGSGIRIMVDRVDTSDFAGFEARTGGTQKWFIGLRETSDENLHIFSPTGGDKFVLDTNSRISLSNNDGGDNSNTVFGALSGTSLASGGIYNVLVGANTGASISTGDNNVALGTSSLRYGTGSNNIAIGFLAHYGSGSGSNNVSIGSESARALTSGANNVAVGYKSLYSISTASANVAIGKETLYSTTTGGSNTALGHQAMYYGTESDSNVAVGQSALEKNVTGDDNTAIGYQSQYGVSGQSHSNNTSVGYQSLYSITTGGNNTALGYQSAYSLTTGQQNVHIGSNAGINATGDFNSFVGYNAGRGAGGSATGVYNVALGREALRKYTSGQKNIAIGGLALYEATSGSSNVAVGDNALRNNTTGGDNVALGANSLDALTSGTRNTALGYNSATALGAEETGNIAIGWNSMSTMDEGSGGTINYNIALGVQALSGADLGSGTEDISHNIAIGTDSLRLVSGDASTGQIAIGRQALSALTSGSANTAIGYESAKALTTGGANVSIGYQAMSIGTVVSNSVAIGRSAGKNIATDGNAQRNTYVGAYAGETVTNGIGHTFVGYYAGQAYDSGNANSDVTYIGVSAGQNHTGGGNNTAIGAYAHHGKSSTTGGSGNTVVGSRSAYYVNDIDKTVLIGAYTVGANEATNAIDGTVAIGYSALNALTSGANNLAIGKDAMFTHTTGSRNIAIGYGAMDDTDAGNNSLDSFDNIFVGYNSGGGTWGNSDRTRGNVAIGNYTMDAALDDARYNTAVGHQALTALTTGDNNSAIGSQSLLSVTTGSSNVAMGYGALKTATTAYSNVVIGKDAMEQVPAGQAVNSCVAIGLASLKGSSSTTTGIDGTVAIGLSSLQSLTSGANSTAVGYQAGKAITTASNSTFIGYNAGQEHVTGDSNIAIGTNAMYDSNGVAGYHNTFLGVNSGAGGWTTSAPTYNVGIGNFTLDGAMNGATGNVALGYGALTSLTEGDGNVALGMNTLQDLNTGTYNTGVGREAIKNVTTGTRNVGLGLESGITLTTGSYNTIIGSSADVGANNHAYTTSIGYQAESENDFETSLGYGGAFKFASFTYGADHASADDGDIASSHGYNIKIPAYSVIKSVSAIITQLANISTYNLAVVYSNNADSPADDSGLTSAVELIGAGASTSKSGHTGNAEDMICGGGAGLTKKSFYNGFDGNGLHVGNGDRYIHLVNAGTGNGDTDPSTTAQVKILVEYVGMD